VFGSNIVKERSRLPSDDDQPGMRTRTETSQSIALSALLLPTMGCFSQSVHLDANITGTFSTSGLDASDAATTLAMETSSGVSDSTDGNLGSTTAGDLTTSGSSTDDTLPDAPALELRFSQVKRFDFDWGVTAGADYYQLLESAAPGEPYVQIEDGILDNSISITMPLHFRFEASYVLRACNPVGCAESTPIGVTASLVEAVGYAKASNTDVFDRFGIRIALSADGHTLAVGADQEASDATGTDGDQADDSAPDAGAVYVFARDPVGQWSQQAYLKASNSDSGDHFSFNTVSLSDDGSTLAVGAFWGVNGNQADNSATHAGAVYVFTRDATSQWSQQAYVKASNTNADDWFAYSLALSGDGNTLAVGAIHEDSNATGLNGNQGDNSTPSAGAVYVFVRDAMSQWTQQVYVKASNTGANDSFGNSVALSGDGNTLVVATADDDSNATGVDGNQADESAPSSGAAYVFVRDPMSQWDQQAYIKASNTNAYDHFGAMIGLSSDGNTLAVGAYDEDSNATGIDGNQADDSAPASGAIYVFARDLIGDWSQQAFIKASNTDPGDYFGVSVALSGDGHTLAVGARLEGSNAIGIGGDELDNSAFEAGAVYLFVRNAMDEWTQQAFVKASNTDPGDYFGLSVALSGDGNTLAVGAIFEDGNAIGIGGDQDNNNQPETGAVYLF
jgi:hypothetical protein